jgi:cytochrome b6-f complex iron-sulfur subunit
MKPAYPAYAGRGRGESSGGGGGERLVKGDGTAGYPSDGRSGGDGGISRRGLLALAVSAWTALALFTVEAAAMVLRFFFPRVQSGEENEFFAGMTEDFDAPETVYETRRKDRGAFIVRLKECGEERLVAVSAVCTHLGCRVNWSDAEKKFRCPCHGSRFSIGGRNEEGPAPRPLERFGIRADAAGRVLVDKGRVFRGEAGEWSLPGSYLPMS